MALLVFAALLIGFWLAWGLLRPSRPRVRVPPTFNERSEARRWDRHEKRMVADRAEEIICDEIERVCEERAAGWIMLENE